MRRLLITVALLATLLEGHAHATEPSDERLIILGACMAIPIYFLDVGIHEGSHAVFSKAFGAEIVELRFWPGMYEDRFYFGLTRWRGTLTKRQRAITLVAPKIVQGVLLAGYSLMVGLDGLPDDSYGQLLLFVLASGSWVDFSKDILEFSPANDLVKAHALYGRTREIQRLPYRLLHVGLSATAGWFLAKGFFTLFARNDNEQVANKPIVFGLFGGSFD